MMKLIAFMQLWIMVSSKIKKKIDIVEGGLYRIRNFMVAHDMSKYKTTTNRYKLRLLIKTSIIPFKDNGFPSSMHKFRDLFEIANDISVDNFQLLDVIDCKH
ncbi:hypothetical protein CASFOL_034888 [Castilleja foliolosa]|uniref:Uncharacterized protein n=1 Tax=Castilleja foliolosa TaxID=1961234 RepID=A0ABD3BSN7_9LAMI